MYTKFNCKEVERKRYVIILNINLIVLLNFLFDTHILLLSQLMLFNGSKWIPIQLNIF